MNAKCFRLLFLLALSTVVLLTQPSKAAVFVWTGTDSDMLWSDTQNWFPTGEPGIVDTALFGNTNTVDTPGSASVNNIVSASTQIAFLQYTNTIGSHNTVLNPGVTLTVSTNTAGSSLFCGGGSNLGITNTISGSGATLFVTNKTGNINVREGGSGLNGQIAVLDMSGLDTFVANVGQFMIAGDGSGANTPTTREVGALLLALTNTIHTYGSTPQFVVALNSSSGAGSGSPATNIESTLYLGITNAIFSDSIEIGDQKNAGVCLFNPAFVGGVNTPVVYISGQSSSRVATFNIGDDTGQGSSNQQCLGLVDFTGGTVNAMVNSCVVGDGQTGAGNATGSVTGTLNMGSGTFNVNTLQIAQQTAPNCATPLTGTVNLEGGGSLVVNTLLELAVNARGLTTGTLNANNSTLTVNGSIAAGGGNSVINISGGTFNLTNAAATAGTLALPLGSLMLSNVTVNLGLLAGPSKIVTSNLTVYGTIKVNFTAVSGFTVFPTNVPVFVTTNSPIPGIQGDGGTAFVLGTLPPNVTATLVNDTTNNSIDLDITSAPVALGQLTWSGLANGVSNGNWDIGVTPNWLLAAGGASDYQNLNPVVFDDTATGATTINLAASVDPSSVTVSNSVLNYKITGTGSITGAGGLTKFGSATLTLAESGGDSFGGGITVSNGTLIMDNANSATAGGTTIASGATAQVGNNDANGGLPAPITDNGTVIFDRSDTALSIGIIAGNGSVAFTGSGTVTLNGIQQYTGQTTVSGGTLAISAPNVSPSGLASSISLTISSGGTVILNNDNALAGSGANPLPVTINTGGTLTGNPTANGGAGTSCHIRGLLTLNGGALMMGGNPANLLANGTWDLQGGVTVSGTNVTSTMSAMNMIPDQTSGTIFNVTNGGTASGIDLNVTGTFISGTSQPDTGIMLNGNGTMEMSGENTYTHGTVLNGGTLILNAPEQGTNGPLGEVGLISFNGGTLQYSSVNSYDYSALFSSPSGLPYSINTAGQNVTFATALSGGGMTKLGAGTLTLTGQNSFSGATTVAGGTLTMVVETTGSGIYIVANSSTLDMQIGNPGDQLSMSDLTNGVSASDTSTLQIDTQGTGDPTQAPVNISSGTFAVNGTVNVMLSGTSLTASTSIPLISYATESIHGSLHFIPPAGFSGSLTDNGSGLISVSLTEAAPSPHFTSISVNGTTLTLTGTGGAAGAPYVLLQTTNLASPLADWVPALTNNFDSSGNLNLSTNIVNPSTPRTFYMLQQ